MQNTGIPTQVFHYRLGGRRNPERPRRDGRPVAGTMHNRIRRTAKTKRALEPCYKKHNSVPTPHWWICAPTYENLMYAVKSGRKPVVGENWDPQSTADGDKTAWQGGITHRHFSLLALNTNTRFPLHSMNRSTAHPFIVKSGYYCWKNEVFISAAVTTETLTSRQQLLIVQTDRKSYCSISAQRSEVSRPTLKPCDN